MLFYIYNLKYFHFNFIEITLLAYFDENHGPSLYYNGVKMDKDEEFNLANLFLPPGSQAIESDVFIT